MKKIILCGIVIGLAFVASAMAVRPLTGNYVTEAIYIASNTAATQSLDQVNISSGPRLLKGVIVNTAGSAGSKLLIYDSQISTDSAAGAVRIASIDTSTGTLCPCDYEIYMSSGIAIHNMGSPPADITIRYLIK